MSLANLAMQRARPSAAKRSSSFRRSAAEGSFVCAGAAEKVDELPESRCQPLLYQPECHPPERCHQESSAARAVESPSFSLCSASVCVAAVSSEPPAVCEEASFLSPLLLSVWLPPARVSTGSVCEKASRVSVGNG